MESFRSLYVKVVGNGKTMYNGKSVDCKPTPWGLFGNSIEVFCNEILFSFPEISWETSTKIGYFCFALR